MLSFALPNSLMLALLTLRLHGCAAPGSHSTLHTSPRRLAVVFGWFPRAQGIITFSGRCCFVATVLPYHRSHVVSRHPLAWPLWLAVALGVSWLRLSLPRLGYFASVPRAS